jgi:hypothetical protein
MNSKLTLAGIQARQRFLYSGSQIFDVQVAQDPKPAEVGVAGHWQAGMSFSQDMQRGVFQTMIAPYARDQREVKNVFEYIHKRHLSFDFTR